METRLSILFYGKKAKMTREGLMSVYLRVTIGGKRFEASYVLRPFFYYSASQFKDLPTAHTVQFFDGVTGQEDNITSNYFTNNLVTNQHKNVIFLYVADVNFYTYSKSAQLNDNNQSDPFAQQVNAKSNVNGGFGCFGAYNVTRVDLAY